MLYLEQSAVFNAINFRFVPWLQDPVASPPNRTALRIRIQTFLCPSDTDRIIDPENLAHNNYRGCGGTLPYNLSGDLGVAGGTGQNNGVFWFQSATRPSQVSDGLSSTAFFSERCLGNSSQADSLADYYLTDEALASCRQASPSSSPRLTDPYEWSGGRWGDGNMLYTRYHHLLPPNAASCLLGGNQDYGTLMAITATSRHPGGVNLLMGDGSVRFVKATISAEVWRAIGSIGGGEIVPKDALE